MVSDNDSTSLRLVWTLRSSRKHVTSEDNYFAINDQLPIEFGGFVAAHHYHNSTIFDNGYNLTSAIVHTKDAFLRAPWRRCWTKYNTKRFFEIIPTLFPMTRKYVVAFWETLSELASFLPACGIRLRENIQFRFLDESQAKNVRTWISTSWVGTRRIVFSVLFREVLISYFNSFSYTKSDTSYYGSVKIGEKFRKYRSK